MTDRPTPRMSIIICLYNAKNFIETCLDSIFNQTFQSFEIIVIDDHSLDGSYELVREKYCTESGEKFDPRIRILRNIKNLNSNLMYNTALAMSSESEYVYFMDHDDALLPQFLEILYDAAEKTGADSVHYNAYFESKDSNFKLEDDIDVDVFPAYHGKAPSFLEPSPITRLRPYYLSPVVWNKITRRKYFMDGTIDALVPDAFPGDNFLFLQEMCFLRKILVIDGCQIVYRKHPDSTMAMSPENKISEYLKTLPTALQIVNNCLSSDRLINPISDAEKLLIKHMFFIRQFNTFVYSPSLGIDDVKFDRLVTELFSKPYMHEPEIMALLLELLRLFRIDAMNSSTKS